MLPNVILLFQEIKKVCTHLKERFMSKILCFPGKNKIQILMKIIILRVFSTYKQDLEYPALSSRGNFPQLLKFYNAELLLEIKNVFATN